MSAKQIHESGNHACLVLEGLLRIILSFLDTLFPLTHRQDNKKDKIKFLESECNFSLTMSASFSLVYYSGSCPQSSPQRAFLFVVESLRAMFWPEKLRNDKQISKSYLKFQCELVYKHKETLKVKRDSRCVLFSGGPAFSLLVLVVSGDQSQATTP